MPIASAISCPLNHLTIIFDTVIPAISTPTPKIANPTEANITCDFIPKIIASGAKVVDIAQYLILAPSIIIPDAIKPVNLTPILSSIIPPMISSTKNTFNHPYALVNIP